MLEEAEKWREEIPSMAGIIREIIRTRDSYVQALKDSLLETK